MARFQFRLELLLEVAAVKEQRTLRQIFECERAAREVARGVEDCLMRLAARRQDESAAADRLRALETEAIQSGGDYSARLGYARDRMAGTGPERQKAEIALQHSRGRLGQAERDVDTARQAHADATRYRQRLEKLKEDDRAEFRREMERKDLAELNEIGATMFYLNLLAEREEEAMQARRAGP